jgi:hypothetical protein
LGNPQEKKSVVFTPTTEDFKSTKLNTSVKSALNYSQLSDTEKKKNKLPFVGTLALIMAPLITACLGPLS